MENLNEATELVQKTQEKDFLNFAEQAKEILKRKTAEKLAEQGYFKKMDSAQGIFESDDEEEDEKEGEKKEDEEDEEEDEKDDESDDNED